MAKPGKLATGIINFLLATCLVLNELNLLIVHFKFTVIYYMFTISNHKFTVCLRYIYCMFTVRNICKDYCWKFCNKNPVRIMKLKYS
jgi:hypothetical protein